ncbi:MAG TPA: aminotransferase class I/II-fold pyridoxal phosphate-dependent enzyme [Eubacteriales bacterium]|nr:aminotransferase class I/II-fold pyridoxal phosphate-dependent enzyme [Eubacteriales bacterium]
MDYSKIIGKTVAAIPPSGIRKYFDILGEDSISFGVGEPDFPTPDSIRQPALDKLRTGRIPYTSNSGDPHLRALVIDYLKERFDIDVDNIDQVLITVGASQAIDLAFRAIVEPGDEVIIHEPSYVAYAPAIKMAGGIPVRIATTAEDRFRVTAKQVKEALSPKTKAILLAFPNNPTGAIMEREDLEAIADLIRDRNLIVVSDEIYAELTFNGKHHVSIASLPGMKDKTIVLNGFSKAFSMTGWRLGYAAGPEPIISAMRKIHQLTMLSAPTTAQIAGIVALEDGKATGWRDMLAMHDEYARRRNYIIDRFNSIGLTCAEPEGAFYVFPSIKSTGMTSEQFCDALLAAKNVACVPGTAFGSYGEGHIRCCYAASMDNIRRGLDRIEEFVKELKK